jgi:hypothetical protein
MAIIRIYSNITQYAAWNDNNIGGGMKIRAT